MGDPPSPCHISRKEGRASAMTDTPRGPEAAAPAGVADITRVFGRIGLLSFGGPAAQIALMHRELVEARPWLTERQYLQALSFCMLLPGPEAMQLATYAGLAHRRAWRGGLIAGLLFVIPGAARHARAGGTFTRLWRRAAGAGAVSGNQGGGHRDRGCRRLAKVSRKALTGPAGLGLAAAAFLGLFVLPTAVSADRDRPRRLSARRRGGRAGRRPPAPRSGAWRRRLRTVAIWGSRSGSCRWPLSVAVAPGGLLAEVGLFFAKLAVVTFGGAYAVLAWMVQEVVQDHRLAHHGADDGRAGAGRDDAGPADPRDAVRGLPGGRAAGGLGPRPRRGARDALGDLRALLPVDLRRAPPMSSGSPAARGCRARSTRSPRPWWGDRQPVALVRAARALRRGHAHLGARAGPGPLAAGPASLDPARWCSRGSPRLLVFWRNLDLLLVLPVMALAGLGWSHAAGLL
jgi:hypothetical protein